MSSLSSDDEYEIEQAIREAEEIEARQGMPPDEEYIFSQAPQGSQPAYEDPFAQSDSDEIPLEVTGRDA